MKNYNYDLKLDDIRLGNLNGVMRFNTYRHYIDGEDCDRSKVALEMYNNLNWFTNNYDNLEPDTMFSPWVIERLLLTKYDNEFYVNNYKDWVINKKGINFSSISDDVAKHLRFEWLLLDSTIEHYGEILSNPALNIFLENAHTIGNFWIVPKKYGGIKCKKFNDCPIKAQIDLMDNFELHKHSFNLDTVSNFCKKYHLLKQPRITKYAINRNDSISTILSKLERINLFIENRTTMICDELTSRKGE